MAGMSPSPSASGHARAEHFDEVDPALVARWRKFGVVGEPNF